MGNGLLPHSRVDNDALEFFHTDCLGLHCCIDGCIEQFFDAGFAHGGAEAANLGGIARQFRRVVLLADEILPYDVLGRAGDQFFITGVKGVFDVSKSAMCRIGRRGRPAALIPASATCRLVPKRSLPATAWPRRFLCAEAGARTDSICAHGIWFANTASGCRRSII